MSGSHFRKGIDHKACDFVVYSCLSLTNALVSGKMSLAQGRIGRLHGKYGGIAQLGAQATSKTPRTPRQLHIAENLVSQGVPDHGGIAQLGARTIFNKPP